MPIHFSQNLCVIVFCCYFNPSFIAFLMAQQLPAITSSLLHVGDFRDRFLEMMEDDIDFELASVETDIR